MLKFMMAAAVAVWGGVAAAEVTMGDDGLHKAAWMHDTFKDLREDLAEANAEGKRLVVMVEQRGCIYCTEMHEQIYPIPEIDALLTDKFFVVQINMFGDVEITDFDGEVLTEKAAIRKWGVMFTPTILFFPEEVPEGETAVQAAVATVPGAIGKSMFFNMLTWVLDHGYQGDENFQAYHARVFNAGVGPGGHD
jgi:thioredoxin-related protein